MLFGVGNVKVCPIRYRSRVTAFETCRKFDRVRQPFLDEYRTRVRADCLLD
jgi:hypothetical protein